MVKLKAHIGIIVFFLILLIGCRTGRNEDKQGNVVFTGHPEEIMAGNFDLKIDIDSLVGKKNSYAFGILDSLSGVLQVFDGLPLLSTMEGDSVVVSTNLSGPVISLVYCETTQWSQISLSPSVANTEALVGFFQYNESLDLDTTLPFIFLIEGVVEQLDWRIVPDTLKQTDPLGNDQSIKSGKGTITDKYIEVIGVYSTDNNHGFTSENIPIHMHFKTADGTLAGHIDHLELGPEMSLRIPKSN